LFGLYVGRGVDAAQPHVLEVALQHGAELPPLEEMEVEGVLEVGRLVGRQHATDPVVLQHPGHLGHVGLGVGEVLDEMRRAGAVEAGRQEAEVQGVHLGHPQALGSVTGGGGGCRLGGVVDPDHLAALAQEPGRFESLATAHVEDAALADPVQHGSVARLVQRQERIGGDALLGPLARQPALRAGHHGRSPFV
jgi:hypothetical protein